MHIFVFCHPFFAEACVTVRIARNGDELVDNLKAVPHKGKKPA
jgi:hypothetical protein